MFRISRRAFGTGAFAAVITGPGQAFAACNEPAEAGGNQLVTAKKIGKFAPNASVKIINAIADNWAFAAAAGLNNPLVAAHFFAQIAAESGGLTILEENLNYSAKRLRTIFPTRVTTDAQALKLAHRPIDIANLVYARPKMGNTKNPDDGWKYRGSGLIQLTFKNNFQRVQDILKGNLPDLNIVASPDRARDPVTAFKIAVAFWKISNAAKFAMLDDLVGVRKKINGGTNGIDVARIYLIRAKSVFKPGPIEAGEHEIGMTELVAIGDSLRNLDYIQKKPDESFSLNDLFKGVADFQSAVGLPATGLPDSETVSAIAVVSEQDAADSRDVPALDIDARIALEPSTK
ncbi:hypothetical protein GOC56_24060 [Sinorhizobium meliloti]|nr:hypothetical protein [Sinorhizobium meliloti]